MEDVIESPAISIDEALKDRKRIDAAFRRAFRKAVLDHRHAGVPMVFWEDGKIVHVDPEQVPLPEVDE